MIQVSSRGGRYAFVKYTEARWRNAKKIIRFADQECSERMSQPNDTLVMSSSTDSNASAAVGR